MVIGIDPGVKTGIAGYSKIANEIVFALTTDFWGCYQLIKNEGFVARIVIEVPQTKRNWHKKGCDITSANVGGIFREATLLAEGLERLGIKVIRQHPQGKHTAEQVKKITGWQGRTNEHTRDAIMLCWGI